MRLKRLQKKWLSTRGGRDESDVEKDDDGMYVMMGDGHGDFEKVYIPSESELLF